jgi:hypothetical protein
MIINNFGTPATYQVTGTGSSQKVEGKLGDKGYALVAPPGQSPYTVLLDGTIDLKGITQNDVCISRYWCEGWQSVITLNQS